MWSQVRSVIRPTVLLWKLITKHVAHTNVLYLHVNLRHICSCRTSITNLRIWQIINNYHYYTTAKCYVNGDVSMRWCDQSSWIAPQNFWLLLKATGVEMALSRYLNSCWWAQTLPPKNEVDTITPLWVKSHLSSILHYEPLSLGPILPKLGHVIKRSC